MDKEIVKQIILASIPLISALISIYILPKVKEFVDVKIKKEDIIAMESILSSVVEFINKMVKAMEQEHPNWNGQTKKMEVLDLTVKYLKSFFGIELDSKDVHFISEVIEGVVKEVKYPPIYVKSNEKNEDDLK